MSGTGADFARDLGRGWKVSPSVTIAPGESFEIAEMYPAFDAVAKLQENKSAQTSIRYALKAEVDHQGIYDGTLKGVEGKKDLDAKPVRVCPICGHTVIGDAPDECPQCGTAGSYFREF